MVIGFQPGPKVRDFGPQLAADTAADASWARLGEAAHRRDQSSEQCDNNDEQVFADLMAERYAAAKHPALLQ